METVDRLVEYNKTIQIPVNIRMLKCNCLICRDLVCVKCYEIEYFMKMDEADIFEVKQKIKHDRMKVKRHFVLCYMKCIGSFSLLYKDILHKRYQPGGDGYKEAEYNFYNHLNNKCSKEI